MAKKIEDFDNDELFEMLIENMEQNEGEQGTVKGLSDYQRIGALLRVAHELYHIAGDPA